MRFFLALVVLLLTSTSVLGQSGRLCHDREVVIEYLYNKYSESPIIIMVDRHSQLVEILANRKTSSWSIVVTTPGRNIGCIVSFGDGVKVIRQEEPGQAIRTNVSPLMKRGCMP
jgi:hypothetical protein